MIFTHPGTITQTLPLAELLRQLSRHLGLAQQGNFHIKIFEFLETLMESFVW